MKAAMKSSRILVTSTIYSEATFPEKFAKAKKEMENREILEIFYKVEVNLPLLDAIKKIPR